MRNVICRCIVADTPTVNGRIYSKNVLERFVRECNDVAPVYVGDRFDDGSTLRLMNVIGLVTDFELTSAGTMTAKIKMLENSPIGEEMLDLFEFSPMMSGTVREDGEVDQNDIRICYFALTPKEKDGRE